MWMYLYIFMCVHLKRIDMDPCLHSISDDLHTV